MPHAIQIRQTGGPEVLNWTPIEAAEPGSGQVRLRQAAVGLNYVDVYHRTGYYSQPLPFIPGLEGAQKGSLFLTRHSSSTTSSDEKSSKPPLTRCSIW